MLFGSPWNVGTRSHTKHPRTSLHQSSPLIAMVTLELVLLLNISQSQFTPEFSFNHHGNVGTRSHTKHLRTSSHQSSPLIAMVTLELILLLNISQSQFTPEFSFKTNVIKPLLKKSNLDATVNAKYGPFPTYHSSAKYLKKQLIFSLTTI